MPSATTSALRAAYAEAGRLVDEFSATLAPERAAQLARAPVIEEIRAAGR